MLLAALVCFAHPAAADPGSWGAVANMSMPRDNLGVGVMDGLLYAVGGLNRGQTSLRTSERYNPGTDSWAAIAPMSTGRYGLGVGVLGNLLYAVGGGYPPLKSAERCNGTSRQWSPIANMSTGRRELAVGVLGGLLYVSRRLALALPLPAHVAPVPSVFRGMPRKVSRVRLRLVRCSPPPPNTPQAVGGITSDGSSLCTAERYNPGTDSWAYIAAMSTGRYGPGVGVLGGLLCVVGGVNVVHRPSGDFPNYLASGECYNASAGSAGSWAALPPMLVARSAPGVGVLDGLLYAVGGQHQMIGLDSAESYSPATGAWTLLAPMGTARSYLGTGVVDRALYAIGGATGDVGFLASAER